MNNQELKQMSMDELSSLYMEKEGLLKSYLSELESQNFLKDSFEYRELINTKNELEFDIIRIDKEFQKRNK